MLRGVRWFRALLCASLALGLASLPCRGEEAGAPAEGGADYVGSETCLMCHEDLGPAFDETMHGRIAANPRTEAQGRFCEACHGPGSVHVDEPSRESIRTFDPAQRDEDPRDWNGACLACHERGDRTHWRGSSHESRGLACVSCHTVMKRVSDRRLLAKPGPPTETCFGCHLLRRAQSMRSSHMPVREGKLTCLSCHNPHGSVGPALLSEFSVNETCYRCHAEKRGPFLWEHAPVREGCTNCHDPHGSIYERLLRRDTPRLCMMCHNASRHPTTPLGPDSRFVFNKACVNCHSAIHGSNHPSGYIFMR